VRYGKKNDALSLSHLEQIAEVRRASLKSGLPLCINKKRGFSRPKISFGPAISLGFESEAEYADFYFSKNVSPFQTKRVFDCCENSGLFFIRAKRVPVFFPSIEVSVNAIEFYVFPRDYNDSLETCVKKALFSNSLVYRRSEENKIIETEIRPFLRNLETDASDKKIVFLLEYRAGTTVKLENVMDTIFPNPFKWKRVVRKNLYWMDSEHHLKELI